MQSHMCADVLLRNERTTVLVNVNVMLYFPHPPTHKLTHAPAHAPTRPGTDTHAHTLDWCLIMHVGPAISVRVGSYPLNRTSFPGALR